MSDVQPSRVYPEFRFAHGIHGRGGVPAGSNFIDHAGLLSEVCLLGNVAVRAKKKLLWDGAAMKITNDEVANGLLHHEYRSGWSLES